MSKDIRVRSLENLLLENIPDKEVILAPWLEERHFCMIHAPTGIGKSFLSLSIGLAIAGGGSILSWNASEPKKVMLIDGEMDIEDIQGRCKLLLPSVEGNHDVAAKNFTIMARQDQEIDVKFPDLASEDGQDVALTYVSEHDPDVIILDNFSTLCEVENENDASSFNPIIRFLARLKQGRKAVILIHHSRKGSGGVGAYRGSTKMAAPFNSIISLSSPRIADTCGAHFELRWEKFRGLRVEVMSDLEVKLIDGQWEYQPLESDNASKVVHLVKTLEYPDQNSLAEKLGVNQSTISKYVTRAIAEKLISKQDYELCMRNAKAICNGQADIFEDHEPNF